MVYIKVVCLVRPRVKGCFGVNSVLLGYFPLSKHGNIKLPRASGKFGFLSLRCSAFDLYICAAF